MSLRPEDLQKLLHLLDITEIEEIDCDEFLQRIAGFIERIDDQGRPPAGYEHVVHHLRVCPECFEEYEAIYHELRGDA